MADTKSARERLVEVVEAHEVESLSCDRDGEKFCECFADAFAAFKAADDSRRTALESIVAQCEVWQGGESKMSAGDFLALVEDEALAALGRPRRWSE